MTEDEVSADIGISALQYKALAEAAETAPIGKPPGATLLQEALKEDDALLNTARRFWVNCDAIPTI